MATNSRYLEFEVRLMDVEPPIWRRFLLRANATLHDLHDTIQKSCGWFDCHLHLFRPVDQHRPIAVSPVADEMAAEEDIPYGTEVPITLVFVRRGDACIYEYDFGDSWEHRVELKSTETRRGTKRRILLDGARAFPPEDCGSLLGYEECVRAFHATPREIAETDPVDRETLLERRVWMGDWNPEHFDLAATQRLMRRPVNIPETYRHDPMFFESEAPLPPEPTPPSRVNADSDVSEPKGRVVSIDRRKRATSAPSAGRLLDAFLADCGERLREGAMHDVGRLVEEFRDRLDSLGAMPSDDHDEGRPGSTGPTYCETADASAITGHLGLFLCGLAIDKMMAAHHYTSAVHGVIPDLVRWLREQGRLDAGQIRRVEEDVRRISTSVPRAEAATACLARFVVETPFAANRAEVERYRVPDRMSIERVAPGAIWITTYDDAETGPASETFGPIEAPEEATRLLSEGWDILCGLVRHDGRWHLVEVTAVLPW